MIVNDPAVTLSLIVPIGPNRNDWENIYDCLQSSTRIDEIQLVIIHQDDDHLSCKKWKVVFEEACRTTILCTEIEGPGAGRNRGLSEIQGKWILFWDSDDYVYIDKALQLISESSEQIQSIICSYETLDDKDTIRPATNLPVNYLQLSTNIGLWRILFRASAITGTLFPSISMAEDQVFFYRARRTMVISKFTKEIIYRYRVGNNDSLTRSQRALIDLVKSLRIMFTEYSGENKTIFSVLVFKQFVALRHIRFGNLIQLRPFFLIRPRNAALIFWGSITYITLKWKK